MPNSILVDNFASLDTPVDPEGVKVVELSEMKPKSADPVTVQMDSKWNFSFFSITRIIT